MRTATQASILLLALPSVLLWACTSARRSVPGGEAGGSTSGTSTNDAGGAGTSPAAGGTGAAIGGGGASTTAPVANSFVQRPCIAAYGTDPAAIYARDAEKRVYTRAAAAGPWVQVSGLGTDNWDSRSGLACVSTEAITFLAAMGTDPIGAPVLANGWGALFNDFAASGVTQPATRSPGLTLMNFGGTSYSPVLAGPYPPSMALYFTEYNYTGSGANYVTPSGYTGTPKSDASVSASGISQGQNLWAAWFDETGLVVGQATGGSVPWSMYTPSLVPTVPSEGYDAGFAPAVCANRSNAPSSNTPTLVVVAGGKLQATRRLSYNTVEPWVTISTSLVATSPSCVVRDDDTLEVVALQSNGSLLYVSGKSGVFSESNLGAY